MFQQLVNLLDKWVREAGVACSVPLESVLRYWLVLFRETIRGTRYETMRGKRSPRGPLILAFLALVLGVGLLSPAWAIEDTGETGGSEFVPPPKGSGPGQGGSGGGEADPDWWQTDVWGGSPISALPAQDTGESDWIIESRQMTWYVESSLGALRIWLFQLSGHRLGS